MRFETKFFAILKERFSASVAVFAAAAPSKLTTSSAMFLTISITDFTLSKICRTHTWGVLPRAAPQFMGVAFAHSFQQTGPTRL